MKTISTLIMSVAFLSGYSQRTVSNIVGQPVSDTNFYVCEKSVLDKMVIDLSYNSHRILSAYDKEVLKKAEVIKIDMVYTDFTGSQDLTRLNRERINKLFGYRKELITDPDVQWKMIRQTACRNESESMVMFHGMVVHFRPLQSKEVGMRDLGVVAQLPASADTLKKMARRGKDMYGIPIQDTSLIRILDRNTSWKEMLIVCDMTGSMSPYTVQLMIWVALWNKHKNIAKVVFFNDGDAKNESEKVIGSIGGIYKTTNVSYEEILNVMVQTISGGCGGDGPENNCEALLEGIAAAPKAKDIILIADNFAPVKDIELLEKINRPVHVIVCGAGLAPVHNDYLQIAKRTGGSVHTMNSDVSNIENYTEGGVLSIEKTFYEFKEGKFVPVKIN